MDGDGDLDFIVCNFDSPSASSSTVSVRLNNGSGTFNGGQDVPVGIHPDGNALGDVDGDGDLDIVAANVGNNSVSVRLNNGQGVFSGTQDVPVGIQPGITALSDVDSDGDLDLLTTNTGYFFALGTSVSVRLNDGHGTFSGTQEVSVGNNPSNLALGDADGDGDVDLFAINFGDFSIPGTTVSVRLNNGSGVFGGNQNVTVGNNPEGLAVGDIDGDGDLDLLTSSLVNNTVSICLNSGGVFSSSQTILVGNSPYCLAMGDVDGDDDLDVLVANHGSMGTVSMLLNGGTTLATHADKISTTIGLIPNPARTNSNVQVVGLDSHAPITLLDALGRPVLTATADAQGRAQLRLPAGLAPGLYLVRSGGQVRRLAVE